LENVRKNIVTTKDGKSFEVSHEGSIGLLALGYIGLKLWREVRKKHKMSSNKNI